MYKWRSQTFAVLIVVLMIDERLHSRYVSLAYLLNPSKSVLLIDRNFTANIGSLVYYLRLNSVCTCVLRAIQTGRKPIVIRLIK